MTTSTPPSRAAVQAGGIVFERSWQVRFAHCDSAGIVFFPQYLVMTNGLVEDWFNEGLRVDYGAFVTTRRLGLPIVKLDCEFVAPSRIGDTLTLSLSVLAVGRSSLRLSISGSVQQQLRFRAEQILVFTSLDTHRPIPLPPDVLAKLQRYLPKAAQHRN
ncbi:MULTISPECIES: thioesterase family protein [Burkholderiaceae]|uniref:acyl-CoA thioesterase n=1 Tax=Burkholderiaceae TaxID=119060 RepID=UPI000965EB02|nr:MULTISPECIES: thioesterase family protein [Burkholderiaceae]MCF2134845.1 acyl-CoA thioesterase [Mycetohabitans sp. B3]MCG1040164.1 acyl-CoA thioesterase [Mycetohabitans sp. B7]SIT65182.1 4-hydroxybenzoyl-CoA thioesterase [Burkholderia sp. b14]